jgi:nucleoside-diphosphate-sugar epimerase
MKKNILVTGAAGFIGSFLCEELVSNDYFVVGIDNFFRGKRANIWPLETRGDFIFEECDLSEPENIDRIKQLILKHNINVVFHLAAINGTEYFYERPLFVLDQNVKMTQNLLSAIIGTSINYFIYTSSSEVYGDALEIPTNEKQPVILNPFADRDSYAASKILGDFYIRLFAKQHHFQALILRVFNMYGERMVGTTYGQVIPEFVNRMLFEDKFCLIGDGSYTRSFCYIKDAVFAMRRLMEKQIHGLVNLGNDQEISILQLAQLMHDLDNRSFNPTFSKERPNDHKRRCPDISYLKSILPELVFTPLEQGLRKVIDFYQDEKK